MVHQKLLPTVWPAALGIAFFGVAACGTNSDTDDSSGNLSSDPSASSRASSSTATPPVTGTTTAPVTAGPSPLPPSPNPTQTPSSVVPIAPTPPVGGAGPEPTETPLGLAGSTSDGGASGARSEGGTSNEGGTANEGGAANPGGGGSDGGASGALSGMGGEPTPNGGRGGLSAGGTAGTGAAGTSTGGTSSSESSEPRTMGYVGCSMSVNVAQGYETLGGERLWPPVQAYNGKVVQNWTNSNDSAWQAFEQQADMYGTPDTVWVMICIFANMVNYDETKQIIANVRERAPDATIYITGQPLYEQGLTCDLAGNGGPELTDEMAQMAAEDESQNVIYGGIFGPMSSSQRSDSCHANGEGQRALGQQAIDKWGD